MSKLGQLVDTFSRGKQSPSQEHRWHRSDWRYESGLQQWRLFFNYSGVIKDGFPYLMVIRQLHQPQKLTPITKEQRKRMQYPDAKGPLDEMLFDTRLGIVTADAGEPEYLFEAYFLGGRFQYAGAFGSPGAPNYHCLGIDYRSAREFLDGIKKPLKMKSDREFLQFFEDRTMPETHRAAVKELLELKPVNAR